MIPVLSISFWRYFDVIPVAVLLIVISYLVLSHKKATGSLLNTISQTVAHTQKSSLIFSCAMTICYPLYYLFLWFWVGPYAHVANVYYYLIILGAIAEALFVWVPAREGSKKWLHHLGAFVVALLMLALPALLLQRSDFISAAGGIALRCFLAFAIVVMGLAILSRGKRYLFWLEAMYVLSFLTALSIVAHT